MVPSTYTLAGTENLTFICARNTSRHSGIPFLLELSRRVMSSPKIREMLPRLISSMMNTQLPTSVGDSVLTGFSEETQNL